MPRLTDAGKILDSKTEAGMPRLYRSCQLLLQGLRDLTLMF
jgi:hypothetical protein